ncbi:MAG TPA: hypothetical protein VMO20_02490 [Candidatus Acidoferrum sp.]|nr:hypothetical protein [Candidatus Acidoferrum sp.]
MNHNNRNLGITVLLFAFVLASGINLQAQDNTATNQPAAPKKLKELPPGNHKLLETMTEDFGLTYDQELEIEPLLHDEESVTRPILGFAPLTPQEKQQMLLVIKHAARRQIRPLLTPEQQQKLDAEDASLNAHSGGGGGQKSGKKKAAPVSEETLTNAIVQYQALTPAERDKMIAEVHQAAQRPAESTPAPASAH